MELGTKKLTGMHKKTIKYLKSLAENQTRVSKSQEKGIRISGIPWGRPPKNISVETKKQAIEDERVRNAIEGKFGQGKRRFSLNKIITKLEETSRTSIAIIFLVMNLSQLLKEALIAFLCLFFQITLFSPSNITNYYTLNNQ
jgi:transposase, IS5 family